MTRSNTREQLNAHTTHHGIKRTPGSPVAIMSACTCIDSECVFACAVGVHSIRKCFPAAMEFFLPSGEAVPADLSSALSVSDIRQVIASSLEAPAEQLHLMQGGNILKDDSPVSPDGGHLTVALANVDLSKITLSTKHDSDSDDYTVYTETISVLSYEEKELWRLSATVSSNSDGSRGWSHVARLSKGNAVLTVVETNGNRNRLLGRMNEAQNETVEEISVVSLALATLVG
eukprot:TRINITY_DN27851_c0_g2_i1.p1 TRINITY_DN27851_c0_g2~~TRINITY_DN27851_c0_g2_i1.p1  ORF type:complete len:231 (+),score=15.24 TRINITY_DN27851_c0_g2_i1:122-814(+)